MPEQMRIDECIEVAEKNLDGYRMMNGSVLRWTKRDLPELRRLHSDLPNTFAP